MYFYLEKRLVDGKPPSKPATQSVSRMVYSTSVRFVFLLRLEHWNALSLAALPPLTPAHTPNLTSNTHFMSACRPPSDMHMAHGVDTYLISISCSY